MTAARSALDAQNLEMYARESQTLDLLLGHHNHNEEHVVYPAADQCLGGPEERHALVEKMHLF